MTTIALVGPDGAGKTTVARLLAERSCFDVRTIYMGANAQSANIAWPWTRAAFAAKQYVAIKRNAADPSTPTSLHALEHRRNRGGRVRAALRLTNRVAELLLRVGVARWHLWRGRVVVFDRSPVFDFSNAERSERLDERAHFAVARLLVRPNLTVSLDAPPSLLLARKPEVPLDYLEARRELIQRRGELTVGFVSVDASRPIGDVVADIEALIANVRAHSQ